MENYNNRAAAYVLLFESIHALVRALGQRGIPAWNTAEAILVQAIAGSGHYAAGLRLIEVVSRLSDDELADRIPQFEGMRAYAVALADHHEARRISEAERSLWFRLRRLLQRMFRFAR